MRIACSDKYDLFCISTRRRLYNETILCPPQNCQHPWTCFTICLWLFCAHYISYVYSSIPLRFLASLLFTRFFFLFGCLLAGYVHIHLLVSQGLAWMGGFIHTTTKEERFPRAVVFFFFFFYSSWF